VVNLDDLNPIWLHHLREITPRTPREQTWRDSLARSKHVCQLTDEPSDHMETLAPVERALLFEDDHDPFDSVMLHRVRDEDGEPTEFVKIEGVRDGGMRTRQVLYTTFSTRPMTKSTRLPRPQPLRTFSRTTQIAGTVALTSRPQPRSVRT
jgi:hypothetical protein